MKTAVKKLLTPIVSILFLLLLVAWMAGAFNDKIEPGIEASTQARPADLIEVKTHSVAIIEPVAASIEAKQGTVVSSRIMARITDIKVKAGDLVHKGQPLLQLEKSDLLAREEQAKSQLNSARVRLKEARKNLDRALELQQKGALSLADLEKSQANHDSLNAVYNGDREGLKEAQTALSYSEIHSPIDGRVVDKFAETGDTAAPGKALLSLYNPKVMRVEAQVREELALDLEIGQSLKIEVPSLHEILEVIIEERVPAADAPSRSFRIKARIDSAENLVPGLYARLLVPVAKENKILIPTDSIIKVGQQNLVYIWQNGQVQKRLIRTGKTYQQQVEVIAGLNAGELLLPKEK